MAATDICSEEEVTQLVHQFYARVRQDDLLGPIFNRHVADWDVHLAKLVDFWSAILRGTKRFSGAPMPAHIALPGLHAGLFQRWLALFHDTTEGLGNDAMREHADAMSRRIAQSFWYGYQLSQDPDRIPGQLAPARPPFTGNIS